ncbi:sigma-54-dependent transcriptional regulator [Piscinibacter sakaiensis]|uniref:Two-component system response regulator n=1 Tax=Piscinibacter sakaiensis TaxID=1547922 RepID=A0A0K8NUC6_PISS1|nr:sigma-54 dependent transcriptional regulator [Piscinibacter sakaiensis]GAP33874.1 two-component system response regulator [Piscinibacter sakaiensis]
MPPALLLVDDDPDVLLAARLALAELGCPLLEAATPADALQALAEHEVAVVLLDLNFRRGDTDGREGLALLARLQRAQPALVVVVVTAHAGVGLAVQAMQQGAADFVAKPWSNERLRATVRQALALHATRHEAERARRQAAELGQPPAGSAGPREAPHGLIGESSAIAHVRALIDRVAPTDANVLVLGENGTGKELVAAALHRASARADGPLVTVDMGAVPATLFDSELFGHRRGAFTDARSDRVGRIAAADGGTLFLDEIGNLPLALQPRLLAVLERRLVTPVGSDRPLPVDLRVVSATNLRRDTLADERQFRADLLWRLNTVEIHVPPLRQRRQDVPLLAEHFLQLYARKYGRPLRGFSEAAQRAMAAHDWPGNVRALRHAVERAVVVCAGARIGPEDLALAAPARRAADGTSAAEAADDTAPEAANGGGGEDLNLERVERRVVERALALHAWNISLAARELGLSRAALYRRMQRHGL